MRRSAAATRDPRTEQPLRSPPQQQFLPEATSSFRSPTTTTSRSASQRRGIHLDRRCDRAGRRRDRPPRLVGERSRHRTVQLRLHNHDHVLRKRVRTHCRSVLFHGHRRVPLEDAESAGASGTGLPWDSGAVTTLTPDTVVVGCMWKDFANENTIPDAPFLEAAEFQSATNNITNAAVYQIVSSTGTYTPSGDFTLAGNAWVGIAVAYLAEAEAAVGAPRFLLPVTRSGRTLVMRWFTNGCETTPLVDDGGGFFRFEGPYTVGAGATVTRSTSVKRSGTASRAHNSGASQSAAYTNVNVGLQGEFGIPPDLFPGDRAAAYDLREPCGAGGQLQPFDDDAPDSRRASPALERDLELADWQRLRRHDRARPVVSGRAVHQGNLGGHGRGGPAARRHRRRIGQRPSPERLDGDARLLRVDRRGTGR